MKFLLTLFMFMCLSSTLFSQTIKTDFKGNYIAVKDTSKKEMLSTATLSGKTYTDTKGLVYPVYISKNNKVFIIKTSKKGNQYKSYLKV